MYIKEGIEMFSFNISKLIHNMPSYVTLYSIFIFSVFFVVPFMELIRCLNNCTFQGLQLNSSIRSNLCPLSNESNDHINQYANCKVSIAINFTARLVKGSFTVQKPPM